MGPKKQNDEYLMKRREQKRLSMQRAREKLKQDPLKHEEVKLADRQRCAKKKQEGKVKSIKEMTKREQRAVRKSWRERANRHNAKKRQQNRESRFMEDITPPQSPDGNIVDEPSTSRRNQMDQRSNRLRRRRNREEKNRQIEQLKQQLSKVQSEKCRYKSRYCRLKNKQNKQSGKTLLTPRSKVSEMAKNNPSLTEEVQRSLLFSEAISDQIKTNFGKEKSNIKRKLFAEVLDGQIIKKCKFKNVLTSLTSRRCLKYRSNRNVRNDMKKMSHDVRKFLEEDICSRMAPGKKDYITR